MDNIQEQLALPKGLKRKYRLKRGLSAVDDHVGYLEVRSPRLQMPLVRLVTAVVSSIAATGFLIGAVLLGLRHVWACAAIMVACASLSAALYTWMMTKSENFGYRVFPKRMVKLSRTLFFKSEERINPHGLQALHYSPTHDNRLNLVAFPGASQTEYPIAILTEHEMPSVLHRMRGLLGVPGSLCVLARTLSVPLPPASVANDVDKLVGEFSDAKYDVGGDAVATQTLHVPRQTDSPPRPSSEHYLLFERARSVIVEWSKLQPKLRMIPFAKVTSIIVQNIKNGEMIAAEFSDSKYNSFEYHFRVVLQITGEPDYVVADIRREERKRVVNRSTVEIDAEWIADYYMRSLGVPPSCRRWT